LLAEGASRPANDSPPATVMPFDPYREAQLRELQERILRAQTLTPALAGEVIARACPRLQARHPTAKARLVRLIESGAFADAMLALLELELPQWKLRRLVCEDGEWHCSISEQLGLPAELDDMAEAQHQSLPLAILGAFLEAARHSRSASDQRQSVPPVRLADGYALCCDNFA
jgi:hypothetical protein